MRGDSPRIRYNLRGNFLVIRRKPGRAKKVLLASILLVNCRMRQNVLV